MLTGLCAAFLLFDALAKLLMLAPFVEGTRQVGYAIGVIRPLGVVLALSTLLHLFPRTQLVGALLLTAYLGGATATMSASASRSGSPSRWARSSGSPTPCAAPACARSSSRHPHPQTR